MSSLITTSRQHSQFLKTTVHIWFWTVLLGQVIFALYILGLYIFSGVAGDFERWNVASPKGFVPKDLMGNVIFGVHVLLAFVITVGGPMQLLKQMRNRFPRFHRINGRLYICSAFVISLAGFYLSWVRGTVGGVVGSIFISINASIILLCAYFTIRNAVGRQLHEHRKWAMRLFLAMSGVWFFRIFLMLWLTIHQAPVGIDMESFQGPALNMLYVFSYIFPVLFVEWYFKAKETGHRLLHYSLSFFTVILTLGIIVGTFSATAGLWLPSL